jgi:hypothetical protein
MTIPSHSLLDRRALKPQYLPVAREVSPESTFDNSYVGSADIEHRVRAALRRYAIRGIRFWQFPVAVFVLFLFQTIAVGPRSETWYPFVTGGIAVIIAVVMPVVILRGADRAATENARVDETYGSSIDQESLLWKLPDVVFEMKFRDIARIFSYADVVIFRMKGSRAICVMPREILPPPELARIKRSMYRT